MTDSNTIVTDMMIAYIKATGGQLDRIRAAEAIVALFEILEGRGHEGLIFSEVETRLQKAQLIK